MTITIAQISKSQILWLQQAVSLLESATEKWSNNNNNNNNNTEVIVVSK